VLVQGFSVIGGKNSSEALPYFRGNLSLFLFGTLGHWGNNAHTHTHTLTHTHAYVRAL
jgi:hypothetical protein